MPTKPIANMRRVQFVEDEDSRYYASKAELCAYCGALPTCSLRKSKQQQWRGLLQKACEAFLPILAFSQPKGLEREFNTFRMGTAWAKRLVPGSLVALMDTKRDEIIGQAKVTALFTGDKREMAKAYGEDNHILLSRGIKGLEAEAAMLKVLRNTFGKLI